MRIVLTGGGTGGHLIPFEPIIEALRSNHAYNKAQLPARIEPGVCELFFVGPSDDKTKEFFAKYDIHVIPVISGKMRRYASFLNIIDLFFRVPVGIIMALIRMWFLMPDAVLSKGGYGSVPVILAAVFYRIPIVVHESDVTMGMTNKTISRFAQVIALTHEVTRNELRKNDQLKTFTTGLPVRRELTLVEPREAKKAFAIADSEPVLLVMGGSQGAEQINTVVLESLQSLIADMSIIHLTGEKNFEKIKTVSTEVLASSPRKNAYAVFPYLTDKMSYALSAADVVVSRAGATSLAELAYARKPSLIIPLATAANNHQQKNAELYERYGAVRVLESNNVTRSLFEHAIRAIIFSPDIKAGLSQAIAKMDRPQAAQDIAQLVITLSAGFRPNTNVKR